VRSSWAVRALLPAAQLVAEGGWLAVAYAAAQAVSQQTPQVGPLELALLAGVGMAWTRRRHLLGPAADAFGLPLLALIGGAAGWFLAPEVRGALLDGQPFVALGLHPAGWLGAVAVLRGSAHRAADEAQHVQQRLLRLAVPGLALPWLIGQLATSGELERQFTAAAFMGTLLFTASAFTALGLAHLESVRLTTGTDWRTNRSWLTVVVGVALAMTAAGIPAAMLLGVPAKALLVALFGPLRVLLLVLLLLASPIVVAAAWVASLRPIGAPDLQPLLDIVRVEPSQAISDAPSYIFYAVVAVLLVVELLFLAAIFYYRWQERRRFAPEPEDFEERSIVLPPGGARRGPRPPRPQRSRHDPGDPAGAYLAALDLLQRDGRWARAAEETPAAHARRVADAGLAGSSLPRLAAAYQLVRYGGIALSRFEAGRAAGRLARLRALLH
jgi:hypothetical protein